MQLRQIVIFSLISLLTLCLTSCGFHPRGAHTGKLPFKKIYIKTDNPFGHFTQHLEEALTASDVTLVTRASQAPITLEVLSADYTQHEETAGANAQIRVLRLYLTVRYELTDAQGQVLVPEQSVVASNSVVIEADQMLGSGDVKMERKKTMSKQAAFDVLTRLSSTETKTILATSRVKLSKLKIKHTKQS